MHISKKNLLYNLGGLIKRFNKGGAFNAAMKFGRGPKVTKYHEGGNLAKHSHEEDGSVSWASSPRVTREEVVTGAEYTEDKPLTGGDYNLEGKRTIGAINPNFNVKEDSLDDLPEEQRQQILDSEFGQTYLSGEGTLDEQYRVYTTKVNSFIQDSPEKALANINKMMETNTGFQTKLEGKSDEEKLTITQQMMSDGKIGDFHGQILSDVEKTPLPQFYNPQEDLESAGFRGSDESRILIASGDRSLSPDQMGGYLAAAERAGLTREDLSQDNTQSQRFLEGYLDRKGSQQTTPVGDDPSGTGTGGYAQHFIDIYKPEAMAVASGAESTERGQQAKERRTATYAAINPAWAKQITDYENLSSFNEEYGTDFKNPNDLKRLQERTSELSPELQEIVTGSQRGRGWNFMEQYLQETGGDINNPQDKKRANDEYHRVMFSQSPIAGGKYKYKREAAQGMRVLKNGGRLGALSSLMR